MKLVRITWTDSYGVGSNWQPIDGIKDRSHICISVGYLAMDGDQVKVIIPHISPENESIGAQETGCGDMAIPCSAIVSMIELIHGELLIN